MGRISNLSVVDHNTISKLTNINVKKCICVNRDEYEVEMFRVNLGHV